MPRHQVEIIESAGARLNAADVDGYLAHFQPGCLHWISGISEPMAMPDFIQSVLGMRRGLPDLQLQAVNIFGVYNFVCAQWRTRGTHSAELFGMPATHRTVSFDTAEVYELGDDGRVSTSWAFGDVRELFRQIDDTKGGPA